MAKTTWDKLKDEDELSAYYLDEPTHPRAAGVMWPAIVERRLDKLFETALRPDNKVKNELMQPSGALGNYAVKVRLAYLLGWVHQDMYEDLLYVAKIRNRFAHTLDARDFGDQKISAWLRNMKCYQSLPVLLKRKQERAEDDPSFINKATAYTMDGILKDDVMAFRFCIDVIIYYLDMGQINMKKNLSDKDGNWLVS